MDSTAMHQTTFVLHGYPCVDATTGAVSIPKYQTSTFHHQVFDQEQTWCYSRFGNPTIDATETCLARLHHASFGACFASGVAAIAATLMLLRPGDHVVVGNNLYGGTLDLLEHVLAEFGIRHTFVDETDVTAWEAAFEPTTRMVYLETPSNPLLTITDIAAVTRLAHEHNALVACDNTFMSPLLQQPLSLGADLVIESATKFLGGHSDLLLGFVGTNDEALAQRIRALQKSLGAVPGIEEAWLTMRGVKTLAVRLTQACATAHILAQKLAQIPGVTRVFYPGLVDHPGHDVHISQATSGGAVLSFELAPSVEPARFFDALTLPVVAVSLGGVESIVSHPWSMSHACLPEAERRAAGVVPQLVRLSVGLEDADDLLADLTQALAHAISYK